MTLNYEAALALPPVEVRQSFSKRDTILYALGLGLGADPLDRGDLAYLYEPELKALPTMPVAFAFKSLREMNLGIDYGKLVHGEQRLTVHRPFPAEGTVIGRSKVVDVIDRGAGKGALVLIDREMIDEATGELLSTVGMTAFCRGDGGFGGPPRPTPPVHALPDRTPDSVVDFPTSPRAALIYRLSGDVNPLHVDPDFAQRAGFDRPILHGLATFGIVGWIVLKTFADHDAAALKSLAGRFSAPVFPGDTLRVEMWQDGQEISLRVTAIERAVIVFNNGRADLA